ncbi:MAG: DUF58 domain-containing protein [Defluviitaleaceae bacterium]|nr:DUF58 domain-containing protein [Defluviitaleaceae bacterium]
MTVIGIFLAIMLAFFIIRLMYRRAALNKLDIQVSYSKPRATEGASLVITTVLTNSMWLPLPWVSVKLKVSKYLIFSDMENAQVTDFFYRNDLYNILMRQRITRRLAFVCGKRGYYPIPSVDIAAWDILMEAKSAAVVECNAHLTVYPATLPAEDVEDICVQIYGQLKARNIIYPDPFSFRGIREYSPHDPLKAVNFKASAKAQELMVNLWEYMNARQVILLYNLQRYSVWHNEILDEYSIKLVASLAERLTAANVPVRFITNGRGIETLPQPSTAQLENATEITEGIGEMQLERILETLAYLDLEQTEVAPFASILSRAAETYKYEPEYWLVSTYHEPDLEAAYKELMSQGARTVWVLPCTVGIRMQADDITLPPEIREQVIIL